ncbi:hypothetical protein [Dictyobacter aurantiacus]|uniref:Uncharacterized protein n=1 Tax=Dictyobacter aurantiacus TaxID=1936993 RepID=A0A401ZQB5_9CHLR|nr:hypothetical protein [Dictyobacter aurantiacus]GCE08974.1 hypothetical protein KDAU_63030 [Dictyobacter aurantiacus]
MKKLGHYFALSSLCVCILATNLVACSPSTVVHHVPMHLSASLNHAIKTLDGFSPHSGDGYTINYPAGWQFGSNPNTGNYTGDFFTDPTGSYAFHVYPSQDQSSAATILNQFLTGDIHSRLQPIAATITVNGIIWQQGKALTTDPVTGKPIEKIGWVARNTVAPQRIPYFVLHADGDPAAFDQYTSTYFLPMLRSFRFTQ